MAHRNKGNGKMPGKHASTRTVRRWRIRHNKRTILFSGSSPPHIDPNVDPSTGGGGAVYGGGVVG